MQVMTFGSTCSTTSAQFVKNTNAHDFQEELLYATNAIRQCHYVEDFVASFATPEDAVRITAEIAELHRRGGFKLRGIETNSNAVWQQFSERGEPGQSVSRLNQPLFLVGF